MSWWCRACLTAIWAGRPWSARWWRSRARGGCASREVLLVLLGSAVEVFQRAERVEVVGRVGTVRASSAVQPPPTTSGSAGVHRGPVRFGAVRVRLRRGARFARAGGTAAVSDSTSSAGAPPTGTLAGTGTSAVGSEPRWASVSRSARLSRSACTPPMRPMVDRLLGTVAPVSMSSSKRRCRRARASSSNVRDTRYCERRARSRSERCCGDGRPAGVAVPRWCPVASKTSMNVSSCGRWWMCTLRPTCPLSSAQT